MKNNLYIVIVGCGRLGSHLANRLSREEHSIVVIDKDEASFNNLSPDFSGFHINGDATQLVILKEAKLTDADVLIATTREDNVNLMVAQIAQKIFNISHVLSRVFDPKGKELFEQLEIYAICPISVSAELFLQAVEDRASKQKGT